MNSPPDPGSPISTDTESPPPEEANLQSSSSTGHFVNFASQIAQTFGSSGAKRRQHALGGLSAVREPKTRRRMEQSKGGGSSLAATWDNAGAKEGKRDERDMIDYNLVEYLRKGVGSRSLKTTLKMGLIIAGCAQKLEILFKTQQSMNARSLEEGSQFAMI
ncbi:hypothetical protein H0H87_011494 [Tephrocybe sp. NHM501043]|nr:hypothetical protein H0H87_011494 [Tephrocybe sp. NHM501043]